MLQSYAVSIVSQRPGGELEHSLHLIEASGIDAAEGRVLGVVLSAGRLVKGVLSRSCALNDQLEFTSLP